MQSLRSTLASLLFLSASIASTQTIQPTGLPRTPNSFGAYHALRTITPNGESFNVEALTLQRDAAQIDLHHGVIYLYPAVNGHLTGAVFLGSGTFHLAPPGTSEQHSLSLLTKSPTLTQDFSTLTLRFTDSTGDELKKAATSPAPHTSGAPDAAAATLVKAFRHKINSNLDTRILQDVLSDQPGGLFLASFKGFGRNLLFVADPQGAPQAAPDQVELATFDDDHFDVWSAFNPATPFAPRLTGVELHVTNQALDVSLDKTGRLTASATTTFTALHKDVRQLNLNLFHTLRVTGVFGPTGDPLDFVQEDEKEDPQLAVLLRQPLTQGQSVSIRTDYSGKDIITNEGSGNYYLSGGARESWYPNGNESLGGFANYQMTFHTPKGLGVVATGQKISSSSDGALTTSTWKTSSPIAVAGFNFGDFKEADTTTKAGFSIQAYANSDIPDFAIPLKNSGILGTMSTTSALKGALAEGSAAIQIYTDFFGPLPFDHVALTQQSACNYGQSWPMLIYLPVCYFWDSTIRTELGLMDRDRTYWTTVTPHEVAHQWWGQTVGFSSYRDQWMSEGFADFSASLYLLATEPKMNAYREYWAMHKNRIIEKNKNGFRPIDAGPVTMGYRLSNDKTGNNVYSMLVYSKGAYILHMIEMLYWTPKNGEGPLKDSLHHFVDTYRNKSATTEDFKRSLEATMPAYMDLDGNKKLDWFFNAYVYGTELPHYVITSDFGKDGEKTTVHIKLTQSNVSETFHMLVPIYIDLGNGTVSRLFNVPMRGSSTFDKTISLGKLDLVPKRLLLNYNYDLLSD